MADAEFYELVGNSDSEDDDFFGFDPDDIGDEMDRNFDLHDDIDLNQDELVKIELEVENEMNREAHDPRHGANFSPWLKEFFEISGPRHVDLDGTESGIILTLLSDEVIDLLVRETNLYNAQFIEKSGGIDNLKQHAHARKWTNVSNP